MLQRYKIPTTPPSMAGISFKLRKQRSVKFSVLGQLAAFVAQFLHKDAHGREHSFLLFVGGILERNIQMLLVPSAECGEDIFVIFRHFLTEASYPAALHIYGFSVVCFHIGRDVVHSVRIILVGGCNRGSLDSVELYILKG